MPSRKASPHQAPSSAAPAWPSASRRLEAGRLRSCIERSDRRIQRRLHGESQGRRSRIMNQTDSVRARQNLILAAGLAVLTVGCSSTTIPNRNPVGCPTTHGCCSSTSRAAWSGSPTAATRRAGWSTSTPGPARSSPGRRRPPCQATSRRQTRRTRHDSQKPAVRAAYNAASTDPSGAKAPTSA